MSSTDSDATSHQDRPRTPLLQKLEQQKDTLNRTKKRRQSVIAQSLFDSPTLQLTDTSAPATAERLKVKRPPRKSTGGMMMGARETEECIDKLKKENFNMKLELYHHRAKWSEMKDKADRAEDLQAKYDDLQMKYDHLEEELAIREEALQDSVRMIDEYQNHVEELQEAIEIMMSRSSDYQAQANIPNTTRSSHALSIAATPIKLQAIRCLDFETPMKKKYPRTPVRPVLEEPKDSCYTEYTPGSRPSSRTPSFHMESPALSVLSESSFASVYGLKNQSVSDLGEGETLGFESPSGQQSYSPAVEITFDDYQEDLRRASPRSKMLEFQDALHQRVIPYSTISLSPVQSPLDGKSKPLRRCVSFVGPEYEHEEADVSGQFDDAVAPENVPLPSSSTFRISLTPEHTMTQSFTTKNGLISPVQTPSPQSLFDHPSQISGSFQKTSRRTLFQKSENQQSTHRRSKTVSDSLDGPSLRRSSSLKLRNTPTPTTFSSLSKNSRSSLELAPTVDTFTVANRPANGKGMLPPPVPKKPSVLTRPKSEAAIRRKEIRPASQAQTKRTSAESKKSSAELRKNKESTEPKRRPWNAGVSAK